MIDETAPKPGGAARMDWSTLRGLARSLAIYYAVPGRGMRLRRFYRTFLKPGDLYFDIGAHVGHRIRAARAVGATVVGVEPQPACFSLLSRLYGRDPGTTLIQAAVGAENGELTLQISSATPTVTTVNADWIQTVKRDPGFSAVDWDRSVTVPATTLDTLIKRHGLPVFCKIDVEGHEPSVLAGLSTPIPFVSIEALPAAPEAAVACMQRLTALGAYDFNLMRGESPRLAFDDWTDAATMAERLTAETRSGDIIARLDSSASHR